MVPIIEERVELANYEGNVVAKAYLDPTCRVAWTGHPKGNIPDIAVAFAEVRPTIVGALHQKPRIGRILIRTGTPLASEAFALHHKLVILCRVTNCRAWVDTGLASCQDGVKHGV